MKKIILFLLASFFATAFFFQPASAATNVNACRNLNLANEVYTLTANVSSADYCFHIIANNVTLNGNGYWINYSKSATGYAINNSGGYDNITIKSLTIVQGSASASSYAIFSSGMRKSNITNNRIRTSGQDGYGMLLVSSDTNTISGNNISTSGLSGYGVYLFSSSNSNNITNNNVTTSGSDGQGVYLDSSGTNMVANNKITTITGGSGFTIFSSSNSNNITNNTVTVLGSGYGVIISTTSTLNMLSNNNLTTSGANSHGVYLTYSDSNMFANNTITTTNAGAYGVYVQFSAGNNITGGSVIAAQSDDYHLESAGTTNNFTSTNFTAQRTIGFAAAEDWFNYNNQTSGNIWLKTSVSAASSINRTLVTWSQGIMKWNDTVSGITASYNITGLLASTQYRITNSSGAGSYSQALTTDSSGNLPSFTIFLNGNTEINAGPFPPAWSANATSPNSPQTYNTVNNYSFRTNWTGGTNAFASAAFRLGSPSGLLANFTDNTTGLVGYWRMNAVNSTNYTEDFSGYGNDGKLVTGGETAASEIVSGKIGNAMDFDGTKDYVNVSSLASINDTSGTICAWIKPAASLANNGIVSSADEAGASYHVWFSVGNNYISFTRRIVSDVGIRGNTLLQIGNWYHACVLSNSTAWKIYLNGTEETLTVLAGTNNGDWFGDVSNRDNFIIGMLRRTSSMYFFNGTIDEVRVYNRSLSADEISALYQMQYPYYAGTADSLNGTWAINFTQSALGDAGTYNYTWFGTDSAGLQNSSDTIGYAVNKVPSLTRLFLNGTEGNSNYNMNAVANITVLLNVSDKTANLNSNISGWVLQSGANPLYNYTRLPQQGIFNITGYFIGDENYSASSATYYASTTVFCSSSSTACTTQNYPVSGWIFGSGGSLLDSGTLKLQIKETGDVFTSSFTGGYFSISPQFCLTPGKVYSFVLQADSGGRKAYLNYRRAAITGSYQNVSCTSSQQSCTFQVYPVSGWLMDSKTGSLMQNGTAKLSIAETGDTFSANFTGGYFSISPQFCLTPGKTYSFAMSAEGNGKFGILKYARVGGG